MEYTDQIVFESALEMETYMWAHKDDKMLHIIFLDNQ